ncbi:MAG TPA: DUF1631 domain-containing protein [Marinobacter sp.]|nr:DUF1631 domain-containing protein [Marinobacter sp.]
MAHDSKVVRLVGEKPVSRFSLPAALVRLRDTAGQELKTVLASFFEQADDSLFSLADRAGSNTDQSAYFDAMRELRLRRKAMSLSVLQYVGQAFNELGRFKPVRSGGSLEDVTQDTLSLMEHSELEEQVAVENLTNRLRNRHQEQIRLLAARVRHLMPNLELTDDQIPLSPEVICGGIAEACADLDIDIRAKLVVLKLFERLLADKLEHFYQQCNQALISEGVLPAMKNAPFGRAPVAPRPAVPSRTPDTDTAGDLTQENTPEDGGGIATSATFSELSSLLRQGHEPAVVSQPANASQVLDTSGLLARLSELQAAGDAPLSIDSIRPLREQLQSLLQPSEEASVAVNQTDGDVINLVAMLFDFILDDRQLHPVMKALIGRLQIPVLKVALSDRNFFNRGGHPVRKLLNELALAAIGWNEKRAGMRDPLREKIEEVVGRVLSEFTDNIELFDDLLRDFGHFMDLDRRRRELVEQRLRDAEEGRARQERAAQMAKDIMREQTEGRDVSEAICQLLDGPCTRYLQWIMLRQGEDSQQWRDACQLVSRLIWTIDPRPVTASTRAELLRAIPDVVEGLRAALKEISWDPFATDAAVRDLELAHVDAFQKLVPVQAAVADGPEVSDLPQSADKARLPDEATAAAEELIIEEFLAEDFMPEDWHGEDPVSGGESEMQPEPVVQADVVPAPEPCMELRSPAMVEPEHGPVVAPEWLAQADEMRVGSWVELQRDDDTRLRCKLAAFIKATGKYIFVNRSGAKVAEYQRDELAAAMQAGQVGMLDDGLIFDRALESIIDNLRYSRKD